MLEVIVMVVLLIGVLSIPTLIYKELNPNTKLAPPNYKNIERYCRLLVANEMNINMHHLDILKKVNKHTFIVGYEGIAYEVYLRECVKKNHFDKDERMFEIASLQKSDFRFSNSMVSEFYL